MADVSIVFVERSANRGRLVAQRDATELGYMTVTRVHDEGLIVDHTVVHEAAKGSGIGQALFDELVAWARKEALYVVPVCSFVKSRFEKDTGTDDVRATCRLRQERVT